MKKFSLAAMNGYTNGESLQFAKHIVKTYNRADIPELKLQEPLLNFKAAVEALEEVFQEPSYEHTVIKVPAMDKRRIELIGSMRLFLKSRLSLKDDEKVSMAQSVLSILKQNCTDIQYGSISHRTERIHAFIRDINSKPNLISTLETFNLQDEFKELTEINQAVFERTDERALGKRESAQTQEKRKAIKDAYDILTQKTNAFYLVADDPKVYETILTEIEKHVDRFNTSVKIRKSLKKKSNGKEEVVPEGYEM